MKSHITGNKLVVSALVSAALTFCATAQKDPGAPPSAPTPPPSMAQGSNSAVPAPAVEPRAAGASEILKMLDAGVSQEVIKAYIEHSPVVHEPSAADIIALKERGVGDDITIALLKRSADLRAQASQAEASSRAAAFAHLLRNRDYGHLDPESYEYFQHYYLYPRTLAWANQRLGYYPSPFYPSFPSPFWGWYY